MSKDTTTRRLGVAPGPELPTPALAEVAGRVRRARRRRVGGLSALLAIIVAVPAVWGLTGGDAPNPPAGGSLACPEQYEGSAEEATTPPVPATSTVPDFDPSSALVPAEVPSAGVICWYWAAQTSPRSPAELTGTLTLGGADLQPMVESLRMAAPYEQTFCTLMGGTEVRQLVGLDYGGSRIWMSAPLEYSTCSPVTNGDLTIDGSTRVAEWVQGAILTGGWCQGPDPAAFDCPESGGGALGRPNLPHQFTMLPERFLVAFSRSVSGPAQAGRVAVDGEEGRRLRSLLQDSAVSAGPTADAHAPCRQYLNLTYARNDNYRGEIVVAPTGCQLPRAADGLMTVRVPATKFGEMRDLADL